MPSGQPSAGSVDSSPKHRRPDSSKVERVKQDLPNVLEDMENVSADESHSTLAEEKTVRYVDLLNRLREKNHSRDAIAWALHEMRGDGLLVFGPNWCWNPTAGRPRYGQTVKSIPEGGYFDYDLNSAFVISTAKLWKWQTTTSNPFRAADELISWPREEYQRLCELAQAVMEKQKELQEYRDAMNRWTERWVRFQADFRTVRARAANAATLINEPKSEIVAVCDRAEGNVREIGHCRLPKYPGENSTSMDERVLEQAHDDLDKCIDEHMAIITRLVHWAAEWDERQKSTDVVSSSPDVLGRNGANEVSSGDARLPIVQHVAQIKSSLVKLMNFYLGAHSTGKPLHLHSDFHTVKQDMNFKTMRELFRQARADCASAGMGFGESDGVLNCAKKEWEELCSCIKTVNLGKEKYRRTEPDYHTFQQTIERITDLETFLQAAVPIRPKPASKGNKDVPALLDARAIARHFELPYGRLEKKLRDFALKNADAREPIEARRRNEPQYVYRLSVVKPVIDKLKSETSNERRTK